MTDQIVAEEWRAVVGYEGFYEVSDLGRVRSLERRVAVSGGGTRIHNERILIPVINASGYRVVFLQVDCKRRTSRIGRMMAESFLGLKIGQVVDHIDGNRQHDLLANLRCASFSENGFNRRANKNNTSGYKGVYASKNSRWNAKIMVNRKSINLGHFGSAEEARDAYVAGERLYAKGFAVTESRDTCPAEC